MNMYAFTIPTLIRPLQAADGWFEKAIAHAKAKDFDPEVFFSCRLAPDMYPLNRQIQSGADAAKFAAAKLCGKQPPSHPDTEANIAELRTRLKTVITYLETFKPEDFNGAEERRCGHTWMGGKTMSGVDYWTQFAAPNFFFHMTTAYVIFRHNGVDVGKMDYLRPLSMT